MAPFLRLLGALAPPSAVVPALAHGPLAAFGTIAAGIVRLDGDELVTLASYGYPVDDLPRYHAIPMSAPVPYTRTVREARIVATPASTLLAEYPLLEMDDEMWGAAAGPGAAWRPDGRAHHGRGQHRRRLRVPGGGS